MTNLTKRGDYKMLHLACSLPNAMLKQLLLLFGLLAVVHCAQKQYAYAYGNPSRSGLQCKDATMIFIELYRYQLL